MILLGTQDPNETFRGKCYYSIVEKLVGGCSAPLCVTVIGHRTWCCLSVAFLGLGIIVCVCSVTQLCPALCDPMNWSPPGYSIHGDLPGKNTGVDRHATCLLFPWPF